MELKELCTFPYFREISFIALFLLSDADSLCVYMNLYRLRDQDSRFLLTRSTDKITSQDRSLQNLHIKKMRSSTTRVVRIALRAWKFKVTFKVIFLTKNITQPFLNLSHSVPLTHFEHACSIRNVNSIFGWYGCWSAIPWKQEKWKNQHFLV